VIGRGGELVQTWIIVQVSIINSSIFRYSKPDSYAISRAKLKKRQRAYVNFEIVADSPSWKNVQAIAELKITRSAAVTAHQ